MNIKGTYWDWPHKEPVRKTVRETIGFLPSLEAGESSKIKWHYARKHDPRHILWMQHTPTGKSAFSNKVYYPQKENGQKSEDTNHHIDE